LGFGGPLNIKFKILLYEKSVPGLHDEAGWLLTYSRLPRCSDSNSNSSVRSVITTCYTCSSLSHTCSAMSHTCSAMSHTCSACQLDQFRTVTHMFRAAIHMKFKFQILRAQSDLDAHLLREKDSLNVSVGWLNHHVNQHGNCSNNCNTLFPAGSTSSPVTS